MPLSKIQTIDNQVVPNLGSRNMIINGSFVVAQRGVTTSTSSGMQTVDRTYLVHNGTDNAPTQAQVDVASGTEPYSLGHRKAFKMTNASQSTTDAGDYIQYEQQVEAQRVHNFGWDATSTSSKITMTFWIKSSVARTYQGAIRLNDSTTIYPWNTGALSANTWTKVTKTIPGASGNVINNDNGNGMQWLLWPYIGTTYTGGGTNEQWGSNSGSTTWTASVDDTSYWTTNGATVEVTGLQIEVGSEATSFEHRSFDDELELCERYFQTYSNQLWQGTNEHATNYSLYLDGKFRKKMRATPTATIVGTVTIGRPQVGVTQRPNAVGGLSKEGFYNCSWPSSGTYGGALGTHGDAYYRMSVGAGPTNRIDFSSEPN